MNDLYGQPQMPFSNDAEAQRKLAEIVNNTQPMPSEVMLNIGPSMHTTLVKIGRIVNNGVLDGVFTHANLIARVQCLVDALDGERRAANTLQEMHREAVQKVWNLQEHCKKIEDLVARQAGELHQLRETSTRNRDILQNILDIIPR